MIVTVTPNTALDVTYTVPQLMAGGVIRASTVHRRAGGKGINVSRVLHALGQETVAVATTGGPDGEVVSVDLMSTGMRHEQVAIRGTTRRTVTIVSTEDDSVTLFNEPGPQLSAAEWDTLVSAVRNRVAGASCLVCSGSLPPGVAPEGYAELIVNAHCAGVPTVLDTSGAALRAGIRAGPDVVKPNAAELRDITGQSDPLTGAATLREWGARAVLVSLGADGLLAVTGSGTWRAWPAQRLAGNATGAGDAAVAGVAMELCAGATWPEILRRAVALSAAAVLGPLAGDADFEHYRREYRAATVEEVSCHWHP